MEDDAWRLLKQYSQTSNFQHMLMVIFMYQIITHVSFVFEISKYVNSINPRSNSVKDTS